MPGTEVSAKPVENPELAVKSFEAVIRHVTSPTRTKLNPGKILNHEEVRAWLRDHLSDLTGAPWVPVEGHALVFEHDDRRLRVEAHGRGLVRVILGDHETVVVVDEVREALRHVVTVGGDWCSPRARELQAKHAGRWSATNAVALGMALGS